MAAPAFAAAESGTTTQTQTPAAQVNKLVQKWPNDTGQHHAFTPAVGVLGKSRHKSVRAKTKAH